MHPAAPEDLPGLVEAFAQTAQALVDLGRGCRDEDFDLPTQCPGWTVKDQLSHVAGVEAALEGHRDPRITLPDYPHLRNDVGRRAEYAVEVRRSRSGPDVVAELEHVLAGRLGTLRGPGLGPTSIIAGPFGPAEAASVARLRTLDVWVHEQDLRTALRRPGNLDSRAAALFVQQIVTSLPTVVARHAGLEPGQVVILDVTGPVMARAGVRVGVGADGRPLGHAMFTGEACEPSGTTPEGTATSISLSTDALTRRAAGRCAVEDTAYHVVGDEEIARRVLEAMVLTP